MLMRLEAVYVIVNAWPLSRFSAKHISGNLASRSVSRSANGRKFLSFTLLSVKTWTQAPNQLLLLTLYAIEMHNSDKSTKIGPENYH